jgi:hypothetical protein
MATRDRADTWDDRTEAERVAAELNQRDRRPEYGQLGHDDWVVIDDSRTWNRRLTRGTLYPRRTADLGGALEQVGCDDRAVTDAGRPRGQAPIDLRPATG